jgi:hypothetical protein
VLAYSRIAGFACPLKAFFSQFPIVSGRRHHAFPSLGPSPQLNNTYERGCETLISIKTNSAPHNRRFPPPWSVEEQDACFVVRDHDEQALAYVYFEDEPGRRSAAKLLTKDEAPADCGEHRQSCRSYCGELSYSIANSLSVIPD